MFCNNCGAKVNEGQQFCTSCGVEIKPRLVGAMKPSAAMPANAKPVPWANRRMKILIWVAVTIFIILPILAAVVLASLNSARQKGLGATSTEQADGWQLYNSVADKFSILFPEFPTYKSETDSSGNVPYDYHTYSAVSGKTTFEVARYVYQEQIDVSEPDNLLERYLNGFVNGTGGQLISSNYTYSGQYRALDFYVSTPNNEDVKGMIVLVDQTMYLIAEDYFTSNYDEAEYQKFINSFSVK